MNTKFKSRKFLSLLVVTAIVLSVFTGLLSGCASTDGSGKDQPAGNNGQKTAQDSTAPVATDAIAIEGFRQLLQKESNPAIIAGYITDKLTQVTKEEADEMVVAFEKAQNDYLPSLDGRFNSDQAIQTGLQKVYKPGLSMADVEGIKDEALKSLLSETLEAGYRVETAEGMYFPIIDYSFYVKFSPAVTEDIKDYIGLMTVESGKVPAKDAALVISWDEMLSRALKQAEFMSKYKDSVKAADAGKLLDKYKSFILYGLNNTPLFKYEDKSMDNKARAAYESLVQKGGGDKVTSLVKEYLGVIANNGYKLTDDVDKFRNDARDTFKLY